jgi:hypothetical protein
MNKISIFALIIGIVIVGIAVAVTMIPVESDSPQIADMPSDLVITENESGGKNYSASMNDSLGVSIGESP